MDRSDADPAQQSDEPVLQVKPATQCIRPVGNGVLCQCAPPEAGDTACADQEKHVTEPAVATVYQDAVKQAVSAGREASRAHTQRAAAIAQVLMDTRGDFCGGLGSGAPNHGELGASYPPEGKLGVEIVPTTPGFTMFGASSKGKTTRATASVPTECAHRGEAAKVFADGVQGLCAHVLECEGGDDLGFDCENNSGFEHTEQRAMEAHEMTCTSDPRGHVECTSLKAQVVMPSPRLLKDNISSDDHDGDVRLPGVDWVCSVCSRQTQAPSNRLPQGWLKCRNCNVTVHEDCYTGTSWATSKRRRWSCDRCMFTKTKDLRPLMIAEGLSTVPR